MEKFLEFLERKYCDYEIKDGTLIVQSGLVITESVCIPEHTYFSQGLSLWEDVGIQLPENLKVDCILDLLGSDIKRLPSNLTLGNYCCVHLHASKFKNVTYSKNCGFHKRTIFAFWANNDFLIADQCFTGTYSEFEEQVNDTYYSYKADGAEYKRKARGCIRRLAQKLGKPNPFKKATAN